MHHARVADVEFAERPAIALRRRAHQPVVIRRVGGLADISISCIISRVGQARRPVLPEHRVDVRRRERLHVGFGMQAVDAGGTGAISVLVNCSSFLPTSWMTHLPSLGHCWDSA